MALSVQEIRDILIKEYRLKEEEVNNIKGKAALLEALNAEMQSNVVFGEGQEISYKSSEVISSVENSVELDRSSPEWSDHVMGLFSNDEVMEKDDKRYPTLKGLRRVFLKIFGSPSFSGIVEYSSPTSESSCGRAHANYELRFSHYGVENVYRGAADAYPGNIAGGYQVYPLAIAENRAEARAYRKALMLNIVTAEEIGNENTEFTSVLTSTGEFNEAEPMSENQLLVIKNKCKELSIDMDTFLTFMKKELGVQNLTKKEGLECVKKIGSYSNDPKLVPGELK